ncbi:hypothetical protein BGZ83_007005 [Gryganskiella cystojenkinii]|nr:hypothetical protein BGZ83_007005 [Gryganskiella cystojenkinii]
MDNPFVSRAVPLLDQDQLSERESVNSTLVDAEVPSLPSSFTARPSPVISASTSASLRSLQTFACTHPLAAAARKRHEQSRDHPTRVHPVDQHVLPPIPEDIPLYEQIKLYITQHHMQDIRRALSDSVTDRIQTGATISKYVICLQIDPVMLLQSCSRLGNQILRDIDAIEPECHVICCQMLQSLLGGENMLMHEQVRLCLRLLYVPTAARE